MSKHRLKRGLPYGWWKFETVHAAGWSAILAVVLLVLMMAWLGVIEA